MIRTQVYLPDELYKQAKKHARISGESISVLMRKGLRLALQDVSSSQKENWLLTDFAAKSATAQTTDVAQTHNEIYQE